jgi:predicted lipoprotein
MSSIIFKRVRWLATAWILSTLITRPLPAQPASAAPSREAILQDLARNVIAQGYQDLAAKCRSLTNAIGQFIASKDQASLDNARKAWAVASDAADRLRCFQWGPVADRDSVSTFYFWQVRPNSIEDLLSDASRAINQSLLDNAGATVKGLYAMEYLLFDRRGGQPTEPAEPARALDLLSASSRRCDYLLAVARDVEARAGKLADDWSAAGAQSAQAKFVSGGQQSLNVLVNEMAQSVENTVQNHLNLALVLPQPTSHQLYRIKGSRSGSSLQGAVATLDGLAKFYGGGRGLGLKDAVIALNPAVATRAQDEFTAAVAATRAVGEPLEQALADRRDTLQTAVDKTRALEVLFKVDLASVLGVTLTFTSGDGD